MEPSGMKRTGNELVPIVALDRARICSIRITSEMLFSSATIRLKLNDLSENHSPSPPESTIHEPRTKMHSTDVLFSSTV